MFGNERLGRFGGFLKRNEVFGSAYVSQSDAHISQKSGVPSALDWAASKEGAKFFRREGEIISQSENTKVVARLECCLGGSFREAVPRACGETIIAAVNFISDCGSKFFWD